MRSAQDVVLERPNRNTARHSRRIHRLKDQSRIIAGRRRECTAVFGLNIEHDIVPCTRRQNLIEIRNAGREFRVRAIHGIVPYCQHAIRSNDDIELHCIRATPDGLLERRKGIFRMRGA